MTARTLRLKHTLIVAGGAGLVLAASLGVLLSRWSGHGNVPAAAALRHEPFRYVALQRPSIDRLAHQADLIVVGRVVGARSGEARIGIQRVLKGPPGSDRTLRVRSVGAGERPIAFAEGEKVLLFLRRPTKPSGAWSLVAGPDGKWTIFGGRQTASARAPSERRDLTAVLDRVRRRVASPD